MKQAQEVKEDIINSPAHYKAFGFESMEMMRELFAGKIKDIYAFNFLKYCLRYEFKNGEQDLEKAGWYLKALSEYFIEEAQEQRYFKGFKGDAASLISSMDYKGLEMRGVLEQIKAYILHVERKNAALAVILADFIELYFNKLSHDWQDYTDFRAHFIVFKTQEFQRLRSKTDDK